MKKLIFIILTIISIYSYAQRSNSIQINIDTSGIPNYIIQKYDIQFSSKENDFILWIHDLQPFNKELLQYLTNVKSVYNRTTKTDHLNLYIESDTIDEFGIEIYTSNGIRKFHNIRWSEIGTINFETDSVYTQKEVFNLNTI